MCFQQGGSDSDSNRDLLECVQDVVCYYIK